MTKKVARRCACRLYLSADPTKPDEVEKAVRNHQGKLEHRQWWATAVINGEYLPGPDELVTPLDNRMPKTVVRLVTRREKAA